MAGVAKTLAHTNQSADGPLVAFAAGCVIGDVVYLHGGVSKARSTEPCTNLYKYLASSRRWELVNSYGPSLSHHVCVSFGDNQIIFIGGWNGKQRTSDIHIYDATANEWNKCETTGFPIGAGLSSHTANLLSNGDILVIGREGSLRMQRRSGNAFILSGSVSKRRFEYKEYALGVASRSGHTTSSLRSSLLIVGGRSDHLLELHRISQKLFVETSTVAPSFQSVCAMTKPPCARKNHSATMVNDFCFVFGGETFDGRSKEPVSELYIIDCTQNFSWKYLGNIGVGRAGHVAFLFNNGILVHGGIGEKNQVSNLTFEISLTDFST
ncbi:kelch domain-containing protein 9-like [Watersipora subatra]|uniref:kelch domain-containing protein 9-like n=1 Tax=Watersipora subatra TaxID=2589382 RepID=UPI00355BA56E